MKMEIFVNKIDGDFLFTLPKLLSQIAKLKQKISVIAAKGKEYYNL